MYKVTIVKLSYKQTTKCNRIIIIILMNNANILLWKWFVNESNSTQLTAFKYQYINIMCYIILYACEKLRQSMMVPHGRTHKIEL